MNNKIDKKTVKKGLLPYVFLVIIILGIFYVFEVVNKNIVEYSYDQFIEKLDGKKIKEMK